jgi:hypothetical protein
MLVSRARCIACVAWCMRCEHVRALRGITFHVMEVGFSNTCGFILRVCGLFTPFCVHLRIFCVRRRILKKEGGGCIRQWAVHGLLNVGVITHYHHLDEVLL